MSKLQQAWQAYVLSRGNQHGWNPRKIFEAGYQAALMDLKNDD